MYILTVYIEGERLELFKDETVSLNQSIQNIKDISKVFTDFTQSFTVPASTINNPIFEHWYNADITGGFNAKVRSDASLELNYMPFKTGKIELKSVKLRNGIPFSYKITFYGDLVNLSDLFGDDKLSDLDLTAYDHDFTSANVLLGINSTLEDGNIIYPLISSERNWVWDATGTSLESDDIKYDGGTGAIRYLELKPAIKINRIIDAIQTDYGVTFFGDFFNNALNHVEDIFLWLSKEKTNINPVSDELRIFQNVNYAGPTGFNYFTFTITPEAGYETVPGLIRIINTTTGEEGFAPFVGGLTDTNFTFGGVTQNPGLYDIYVSVTTEYSFTASYELTGQGASDSIGVTTISNGNTTISANMPDMKLTDFVGGLVKMFNLVIEPITSTTFNIKPLDEWYLDGVAKDITKYIEGEAWDINKPKLYKRIDFSYEESETILNTEFRETNGRGYGNLEAEFTYDGGVLEINVPFENLLMERLPSQLANATSDVHVGKAITVDNESVAESVETAPILFYNRGIVNLTDGFGFSDEAAAVTEITTYYNIGQEDKIIWEDITQSLNFGSEIGSYIFAVPPVNPDSDGGLVYSLFSNYWEDYITDLYDNKRREYSFKAVFPVAIAQAIRLNNVLIIRDRLYTINTINTNLTTGDVKLGLLNYIGVVPDEIPVGFVGFDYVLDFNIN